VLSAEADAIFRRVRKYARNLASAKHVNPEDRNMGQVDYSRDGEDESGRGNLPRLLGEPPTFGDDREAYCLHVQRYASNLFPIQIRLVKNARRYDFSRIFQFSSRPAAWVSILSAGPGIIETRQRLDLCHVCHQSKNINSDLPRRKYLCHRERSEAFSSPYWVGVGRPGRASSPIFIKWGRLGRGWEAGAGWAGVAAAQAPQACAAKRF
jgi:hypothetical protein